MSGISVAEKSEDQAFINAMPTRFASFRGSRRDMIFCHRYSTYSSHFLWRGLLERHYPAGGPGSSGPEEMSFPPTRIHREFIGVGYAAVRRKSRVGIGRRANKERARLLGKEVGSAPSCSC